MNITYEPDCHFGTTKMILQSHSHVDRICITADICYMHLCIEGKWGMLLSRNMCDMIRSLLIRSRKPPYKDEVPLYSASSFDDSLYYMSIETVKDLIPTLAGPMDGIRVGFSDRSPLLRDKKECMICITNGKAEEIADMLETAIDHQKKMKKEWKEMGQLWKNRDGTVTERPKRD